jgi:hypothetical protein
MDRRTVERLVPKRLGREKSKLDEVPADVA